MTLLHWLNYSAIIVIIGICCYLTYFIAGAKYSLIKAFVRAFMGDFWYLRWYCKNSIYIWCVLARLFLICTELTLITQFAHDNIFQKPFFIFIVSPLLWISLFGVISLALHNYNKAKSLK